MTPTQARQVFAALMQKARGQSLTINEKARLGQARQILRTARRPAMNAGGSGYWIVRTSTYPSRYVASRGLSPHAIHAKKFGSYEDARKAGQRVFKGTKTLWQIESRDADWEPMGPTPRRNPSGPPSYIKKLPDIHSKLVHTLTAYDIQQSKKKGYNPYALPQYIQAVNGVDEDMAKGATVRQAILNNFVGRILPRLFKAVGEPPPTDNEIRYGRNPRRRQPSPSGYRPPQEFHGTTHRGYSIQFNALRNEYWIEKDGAFISYASTITDAKKKIDAIFGDNPRRRAKPNPSGSMRRLGRALEVRYQRQVGSSPGYYKHEIKSRRAGVYTIPAGWVYVSSKSVLITESTPKGKS